MICKICGVTNPDSFYKSIGSYCRLHWRERVKTNRKERIEHYTQYERNRTHRPDRIALRNPKLNGRIGLYCVIPSSHPAASFKMRSNSAYLKRNPKKRYAHSQVAYAVDTGKMIRQPCEVCGEPRTEAHHDDYNKPLDVRWLCNAHHKDHHAGTQSVAQSRSQNHDTH